MCWKISQGRTEDAFSRGEEASCPGCRRGRLRGRVRTPRHPCRLQARLAAHAARGSSCASIFIPESARKIALSDPRSDAAALRARSAVPSSARLGGQGDPRCSARPTGGARAPARRPGRGRLPGGLHLPRACALPRLARRRRHCGHARAVQGGSLSLCSSSRPHVQSLTSGLSGRCWFAGSHRAPRLLAPWSMTAPALWTASSWSRTASWRPA